jgi:hypothetical protein
MWVWLALGWSIATLALSGRYVSSLREPALTGAALVVVTAVAVVVAVGGELPDEPYDQMGTIAARLDAELPAGDSVRVDTTPGPLLGWNIQAGIVYDLRRSGRAVVAPSLADYLGPEYRGGYDQLVRVYVDTKPTAGRTVADVTVTQHPDPAGDPFAPKRPPKRKVVVTVTPGGSSGG